MVLVQFMEESAISVIKPLASHAELCTLFNRWNGDIPDNGWLVSEKIDGFRCLWFDGEFHTRNGLPLYAVDHFKPIMRLMEKASGQRLFLDMEFQVDGSLAATKAYCEREWKGSRCRGALHLFDALPAANWFRGDSDWSLCRRLDWLPVLLDQAQATPDAWEIDPVFWNRVKIIQHEWMADAGDIRHEANRVWARGGEGLVLKDPIAIYERKRVNHWRKVKK